MIINIKLLSKNFYLLNQKNETEYIVEGVLHTPQRKNKFLDYKYQIIKQKFLFIKSKKNETEYTLVGVFNTPLLGVFSR